MRFMRFCDYGSGKCNPDFMNKIEANDTRPFSLSIL